MNWANVFTVYFKELRDSLRDRRTLLSTIVVPMLIMPLLTFGLGKIATTMATKARAEIPTVMIIGGGDSPGVVAGLERSKKLRVVPARDDWKQQIADKKIRAAVEIPAGFEAGLKAGAAPTVTIYHYEGEIRSKFGADELEVFFRDLRQKTVAERLAERGVPATIARVFDTNRLNVAPPEKVGGATFGGIVPYMIIILCFTGAMYPGIDLTAGEKERGTMETVLCSPVRRVELVLGKFLMVLTGSLSAMVFAIASMTLSFFLVTSKLPVAAHATAARAQANAMPTIDPLGVFGVLALIVPVAVLFSAVIFTVSLFAKSYKEAQSYVGPMIFVVIMPAAVAMLPGIELDARLALVPILNVSLACKEMLSGVWHWSFIALIFGSTCIYAAIALGLAVRMFEREDVLFRT